MRKKRSLSRPIAVDHEALGAYVTAYSTDLPDMAQLGMTSPVVVFGHYESWDEATSLERVSDLNGTYQVNPNAETRVGSAGSEDHVTLGRVRADGVLDEITWWDVSDVLRMTPDQFMREVERHTNEPPDKPQLTVVR